MRTQVVVVLLAVIAGAPRHALAEQPSPVEKRLRALEGALRDAQKEIDRLREEVRQQRAISQGTQTQIDESRKAQEEQTKKIEEARTSIAPPEWLKRITLFGDVRVRHEGFYNQPSKKGTETTARNRERVRARIGAKVTYSDELSATIRLASGNPDDPISTNETLGNAWTPKHINLDWAYLTFTPGKTFGIRPGVMSLSAGKFPNPVFRVGEMVWDDDLSPEGLYQTFALLDKPQGALDQVKLHVLQWTFMENSNAQDGWMFGGQVNPTMHVGSAQIEAGIAQYWYLNPNFIAQKLNTDSALKNTNLTTTGLVSGETQITGFQSGFNLTNTDLAVTFPNAVGTMPLRLFTDYVYNWQAATDDAHGVQAGARLGQPKKRGDWAATAYYEYLGQEAALSTFSNSDFGNGGTGVQGPVATLEYQLLDPITLRVRNFFTNTTTGGVRNPTMFRLQLDAEAKF